MKAQSQPSPDPRHDRAGRVRRQVRLRLRRDRPCFAVSESARTALLNQCVAAVNAHDQDALLALFAEDATWTSDGGRSIFERVCLLESEHRVHHTTWR